MVAVQARWWFALGRIVCYVIVGGADVTGSVTIINVGFTVIIEIMAVIGIVEIMAVIGIIEIMAVIGMRL